MMETYPKIQSVYKRHAEGPDKGKFIIGQYSIPEIEYLAGNEWEWTEKVDGTNVRIGWDGERVQIGGRTDNAQMPVFLMARLQELFPREKMIEVFGASSPTKPPYEVTLYGEGYGRKIQKVGSSYLPDSVDFILFDVRVGDWWFKRVDVVDVAVCLEIKVVPVVLASSTVEEAIDFVKRGSPSIVGKHIKACDTLVMEGLVGRTLPGLKSRSGQRIITKVKTKDFQ